MKGTLVQLCRNGAGLIVEDAPESRIFGLAKTMLKPASMTIDEFLALEGHRVEFQVVDDTAINLVLAATARN